MDSGLERLQKALNAAMAGRSAEEMSWHPPGKWCAAEVLEHLYLTYTGTIKGMERALEAGRPLASQATLKNRVQSWVVIGLGYFPEGRKSPKQALPRGLAAESVRGEIVAKIQAMDEIIARCEEQFGRGTRLLDHPILGPLTGAEWRKFHVVHGLHHEKQLRRLCEAARSPAANLRGTTAAG